MARITYDQAKDVLTDAEKNRLIACYFAIESPNTAVNYDLAAKEYGAKSTESFKKMIFTAFKKVEKSLNDGGSPSSTQTTDQSATPAKGRGGRKRKAADHGDAEADANDSTPTKKPAKRGRPKKVKSEKAIGSEGSPSQLVSGPGTDTRTDEAEAGNTWTIDTKSTGGLEDHIIVKTEDAIVGSEL
ncbi:hypothetical protein ANO11243_047880 [Dothideomycetidae sp. 11243]|nr:hypothetical protein ANO11243_047880 [fungal sp. No.11243]